jgi:hypothetical protein
LVDKTKGYLKISGPELEVLSCEKYLSKRPHQNFEVITGEKNLQMPILSEPKNDLEGIPKTG